MRNHKNFANKLFHAFIALTLLVFAAPVANASGLQGSKLYIGTAQLISDLMLIITILCPTVCGVAAVYFAIRRGMADEQDGKMWTKRITTAVICGVLGGLISGLISLIASYYA